MLLRSNDKRGKRETFSAFFSHCLFDGKAAEEGEKPEDDFSLLLIE